MSDNFTLGLALISGLALGIFFFGGLWLTVQRMVSSKISPLWLMIGSIFRLAVVCFGFYYIGKGNWKAMCIALGGFILARFVIMQFTKKKKEQSE